MNLYRKMADLIRRLGFRDPEGWRGGGSMGDSGEHVSSSTSLGVSAVWACVNLVSGTISSLPLMVYRRGPDGSRVVASDHPLYRLLHDSPNYDQTAVDFWDFVCASIELHGNAYARIQREGARIVDLTPVRPDPVTVKRLQNGTLEYSWSEDGKTFREPDARMLHIRGAGGNPLGGLSTLHYARNTFALAQAAEKAASGMFKNGLRPSGVLSFPAWLTKDQRDVVNEKLTEKYLGAMNSSRPLILEGGTKWENLAISPEDAQMLQTRAFSVEEICRFFGVPPHMIGHTEKSTSWGSGLEQQTLGFLQFTFRRRLKRIEQAAEKQLLTPADRIAGVRIEFNVEGLLRADSAGRASFYREMTAMGAMTINEVRALENMPRVEGGDVPRMQSQNVPITQAGQAPAQIPAK